MKRKINQVGTGTLTISLPMKWARRNNLKKGQEVEVSEKEKILTIEVHPQKERREITIKLDGPETPKRKLILPYIRGYDKIKILCAHPADFQIVEETLPWLFGFEMLDQQKDHCLLQSVAQGLDSEFSQIKCRVFFLTFTMLKETLLALEENNYSALEKISHQEQLMNKLNLFLRRMLHLQQHEEEKVLSLYSIFLFMEDITDHLGKIDKIYHQEKSVDKIILIILKNILLLFTLLQTMQKKKQDALLTEFKKLELKTKELIDQAKITSLVTYQTLLCLYAILSDLHNLSEEILFLEEK